MSAQHLSLAEPFQRLWSGIDPFLAVEDLKGEVFRELEARRTLRVEIDGCGYFVKIHRGVGWREIVKNVLSMRLPVLGAANEWEAIHRLAELGIDTMHGVAFGQRGANPARQHSFIITEELAPTISLEDFCRDWPVNPPTVVFKRALIGRVAEMAKRMHRGGVNHRDFYICHFLLHLDPVPTASAFKLSLIDLHRAQLRAQTPRRWRNKDLSGLFFSAQEIGLTSRDFYRFLRRYFDQPLRSVLREESVLLRHLVAEAARLQKRFERKYAPKEKTA